MLKPDTFVAVASTNPAKVEAVRMAVRRLSPFSCDVRSYEQASGVREQPIGEDETLRGAWNRAQGVYRDLDVDYCIGIEGGIVERRFDGRIWHETRAAVVILDREGRYAVGWSAAMMLPKLVAFESVEMGRELRDAAKVAYGDAVGRQGIFAYLTKDAVTRSDAYADAIVFALGSLAVDPRDPADRVEEPRALTTMERSILHGSGVLNMSGSPFAGKPRPDPD